MHGQGVGWDCTLGRSWKTREVLTLCAGEVGVDWGPAVSSSSMSAAAFTRPPGSSGLLSVRPYISQTCNHTHTQL